PYFGVCGGCAMQHLDPAAQVAVKQRVLEDALAHIGKVRPNSVLPPMYGPSFGYRYRARLSVRLVHKKGGVVVGFRERRGSDVGECGGCAMKHLDPAAQVAVKQRVLEDALAHIGKVRPNSVLPPMYGPSFGYRYRARLSVRLVHKKGGVLVGFRERRGSYVADMQTCLVLPPAVSALLMPLRTLVGSLAQPARIPQIELAVGDRSTALLLRHMEPLTSNDISLLRAFADQHNVTWWLQPKGPETVHLLDAADEGKLAYTLPEFGLRMPYRPTDFTQVNHEINRSLVSKALSLLDVQSSDRVADMFCGLGN